MKNKEKIPDGCKKCCACKLIKPVDEFGKNKRKKGGYGYKCKPCRRQYEKSYVAANKELRKAIKKRHSLKNKDKIKAYKKKYNSENKDLIKKTRKKYNSENKHKRNISRKEYYLKNPQAKMAEKIRVNILSALRAGKARKSNNTVKLLGCTIEHCLLYLESKFTKGMNWDNYGLKGWHIDHIKPCASFDLSKEEEQKKCFHYTNLQPLWATTEIAISYGECPDYVGNIEKGCKLL
jgi:hypothetical protein